MTPWTPRPISPKAIERLRRRVDVDGLGLTALGLCMAPRTIRKALAGDDVQRDTAALILSGLDAIDALQRALGR